MGFQKGTHEATKDKSILNTCIREFYEETGLQIMKNNPDSWAQFNFNNNFIVKDQFYCIILINNNEELYRLFGENIDTDRILLETKPIDTDEVDCIEWKTRDEILKSIPRDMKTMAVNKFFTLSSSSS